MYAIATNLKLDGEVEELNYGVGNFTWFSEALINCIEHDLSMMSTGPPLIMTLSKK